MSLFKISIVFLSVFLVHNISFSQSNSTATDDDLQLNTITTALPFLSITPDSRAGGMGEAGTALSGNSTSIYWNTSMLSFAEKKSRNRSFIRSLVKKNYE